MVSKLVSTTRSAWSCGQARVNRQKRRRRSGLPLSAACHRSLPPACVRGIAS